MATLYNRVRETATTTGTGSLTLLGAVTGFHAFNDKVTTATTVRYVIVHRTANEFEYGLGTFTATATLARTTVLGGSNGASAVSLTAGTKDVFVDLLAEDAQALQTRPGWRAGLFYFGAPEKEFQSEFNGMTLDLLYATPFYVGAGQAFDGIAFKVAGVASSFLRTGIYADDGGKPGALLVDAGQTNCAVSGEKVATIALTLSGTVWLASVAQGVKPSAARLPTYLDPRVGLTTIPTGSTAAMGYSQASISGALPSPWGATYTLHNDANAPALFLRAA